MMTEKQKQTLTVGVIMAVLLAVILAYWFFMSVRVEVAKSRETQDKLRAEIQATNERLAEIDSFLKNRGQLEQMLAEVNKAKRRLPSDPQAIEFLAILTDSLNKTGVSVSEVTPQPPVNRSMYTEIPYLIKGSARYHEFGQFLNLIECHPERFMRVSAFRLLKNDKRPSIHPMEARIQTFMFKES
jgi:Tfp pilus assembly protein PilO